VGPGGSRNIEDLAALAEKLDSEFTGSSEASKEVQGVDGAVMYVRDACGFSRAVTIAIANLGLSDVEIRNVSQDEGALQALRELTGAETAPCLAFGGEVISESSEIIGLLAGRASPMVSKK
jgi:glutaredoxin-related protein